MAYFEFPHTRNYDKDLGWLIKNVKEIILDVQAQDDKIAAVQQLAQELQDFVNNYFENLDVQVEINNKIQAMVSDGSLQALIEEPASDAAAAWLAEHITPTTPPVDSSLTIAGAAADAKATGDKITELRNDLYTNSSVNIADFVNTGVALSDGTFGSRADHRYILKGCIGVTTITATTALWSASLPFIVFYDADFHVISYISATATGVQTQTVDVPDGAVKYAINCVNDSISNLAITEAVNNPATIPEKQDAVITYRVPDSELKTGLALADGTFGTATAFRYIHRSCNGIESISVVTPFWSSTRKVILFYDADGNVISTVDTITGITNYGTIDIPAGAAMYAVNLTADSIGSFATWENYNVSAAVIGNANDISAIKSDIKDESSLVLPAYIYGVVGHPTFIYYENILKNGWLKDYTISNDAIQTRRECYKVIPAQAGEQTIPIIKYKGRKVIESKSVVLRTVAKNTSGSAKVLIIGDSKSASNAPWETLAALISADSYASFTFLGLVDGAIKREAYSGKSIINLCDDPYISGSTPNIFYDATITTAHSHHFSFAKGVNTLGTTPDIVVLDYGANQWSRSWDTIKGCYDDVIASIRATSTNVKIVIVAQEGTGLVDTVNYQDDGKWSLENTNYTTIGQMVSEYQGRESENVYLSPQYIGIDLYHGFPICELPAFDGASGTVEFSMDNTHPGLNADLWNSGTAYSYGDWVNRNGAGYGCKKANTGIDPESDNGTYWTKCENLNDGYRQKGQIYYNLLKYLLTV